MRASPVRLSVAAPVACHEGWTFNYKKYWRLYCEDRWQVRRYDGRKWALDTKGTDGVITWTETALPPVIRIRYFCTRTEIPLFCRLSMITTVSARALSHKCRSSAFWGGVRCGGVWADGAARSELKNQSEIGTGSNDRPFWGHAIVRLLPSRPTTVITTAQGSTHS